MPHIFRTQIYAHFFRNLSSPNISYSKFYSTLIAKEKTNNRQRKLMYKRVEYFSNFCIRSKFRDCATALRAEGIPENRRSGLALTADCTTARTTCARGRLTDAAFAHWLRKPTTSRVNSRYTLSRRKHFPPRHYEQLLSRQITRENCNRTENVYTPEN